MCEMWFSHNAELQAGFRNREYILSEGDVQAVCVELEGTLQRPTEAILVDGEAIRLNVCAFSLQRKVYQ